MQKYTTVYSSILFLRCYSCISSPLQALFPFIVMQFCRCIKLQTFFSWTGQGDKSNSRGGTVRRSSGLKTCNNTQKYMHHAFTGASIEVYVAKSARISLKKGTFLSVEHGACGDWAYKCKQGKLETMRFCIGLGNWAKKNLCKCGKKTKEYGSAAYVKLNIIRIIITVFDKKGYTVYSTWPFQINIMTSI